MFIDTETFAPVKAIVHNPASPLDEIMRLLDLPIPTDATGFWRRWDEIAKHLAAIFNTDELRPRFNTPHGRAYGATFKFFDDLADVQREVAA